MGRFIFLCELMGKGNGQFTNPMRELPPHKDSRYALENRGKVLACERIENAQRQQKLFTEAD
jgi:hypothetical protein